ncbi:MAG: hypothetical protein JXA42_12320 [Anaerolineales bacterium]|nr:hypothetical protein [Anaerolineales bacterium]
MEVIKKEYKNDTILSKIAGLLLLIISLPLLVIILNYLVKDFSIWFLGQRITAEVVDLRLVRTSSEDETEYTFDYFVDYAFKLPNGDLVIGSSAVGGMEWSGMKKGGPVLVKYFPLYPSHNRLDDSRFVGFYICTYIPITAFVLAGFLAAVHLLRPQKRRNK